MDYRQEMKYLCSEAQLTILRSRLSRLMRPDEHQRAGEGYFIRSLYFDDIDDRFLNENLRGMDDRVKFRIRIYDRSDSVIHLETKYKLRSLAKKEHCDLTRAECESLMAGKCPSFSKEMPKPLKYLYTEMQSTLLRPVVIVEYRREALVERLGNVRVTFDRNIASCLDAKRFLELSPPMTPLLPPGQHILEVKYDEFIPDYLVQAMDLGDLEQTTFSKYAMCRSAL